MTCLIGDFFFSFESKTVKCIFFFDFDSDLSSDFEAYLI
jgi:hypothetical protein